MATIGIFSRHEDRYYGSIHTLTVSTRVEIVPSGLDGEKTPQHLVVIGDTHVGAGWDRSSRDGGSYIAVKLDDPSFPAPIFANLVERGNEHHLIWSREEARQQQVA
jgi:uncharacterized protein (DUF736 family)